MHLYDAYTFKGDMIMFTMHRFEKIDIHKHLVKVMLDAINVKWDEVVEKRMHLTDYDIIALPSSAIIELNVEILGDDIDEIRYDGRHCEYELMNEVHGYILEITEDVRDAKEYEKYLEDEREILFRDLREISEGFRNTTIEDIRKKLIESKKLACKKLYINYLVCKSLESNLIYAC